MSHFLRAKVNSVLLINVTLFGSDSMQQSLLRLRCPICAAISPGAQYNMNQNTGSKTVPETKSGQYG